MPKKGAMDAESPLSGSPDPNGAVASTSLVTSMVPTMLDPVAVAALYQELVSLKKELVKEREALHDSVTSSVKGTFAELFQTGLAEHGVRHVGASVFHPKGLTLFDPSGRSDVLVASIPKFAPGVQPQCSESAKEKILHGVVHATGIDHDAVSLTYIQAADLLRVITELFRMVNSGHAIVNSFAVAHTLFINEYASRVSGVARTSSWEEVISRIVHMIDCTNERNRYPQREFTSVVRGWFHDAEKHCKLPVCSPSDAPTASTLVLRAVALLSIKRNQTLEDLKLELIGHMPGSENSPTVNEKSELSAIVGALTRAWHIYLCKNSSSYNKFMKYVQEKTTVAAVSSSSDFQEEDEDVDMGDDDSQVPEAASSESVNFVQRRNNNNSYNNNSNNNNNKANNNNKGNNKGNNNNNNNKGNNNNNNGNNYNNNGNNNKGNNNNNNGNNNNGNNNNGGGFRRRDNKYKNKNKNKNNKAGNNDSGVTTMPVRSIGGVLHVQTKFTKQTDAEDLFELDGTYWRPIGPK